MLRLDDSQACLYLLAGGMAAWPGVVYYTWWHAAAQAALCRLGGLQALSGGVSAVLRDACRM